VVKKIEFIPGAKLISYYLDAGTAQNIAIIAVPDTDYPGSGDTELCRGILGLGDAS